MLFSLAYLGNAAANFLFGIVVGSVLGPAEYGRYATAALAATVVAALAFDWLRLSTNRFWLALPDPNRASASLEAGFSSSAQPCSPWLRSPGVSGSTSDWGEN